MSELPYYKQYLKDVFIERKYTRSKKKEYSLRDFARSLDIDPSVMSRVLSNQRGIRFKTADKIVTSLRLKGIVREKFLSSVFKENIGSWRRL